MALSRHKTTHGSSWPWKINIGHTESRAERLGLSHHFSQATCKMLKTLMSSTQQQETREEAGGFSSTAAHALWNFLMWCIEFVMHQGGSQRKGILKARTPNLARVNWLGVCSWDFFFQSMWLTTLSSANGVCSLPFGLILSNPTAVALPTESPYPVWLQKTRLCRWLLKVL